MLTALEFANIQLDALEITDPDIRAAFVAAWTSENLTSPGLALAAAQLAATMKSRNLFGPEVELSIDEDGLLEMGSVGPETHLLRIVGDGPVVDLGATATLLNPYYFGFCEAETTFTADPDRIVTPNGDDVVVDEGGYFLAQLIEINTVLGVDIGKWRFRSFGGSQGPIGNTGPAAWAAPAAWATATAYTATAPRSVVTQGGETYVCLVSHTSGTFATDLAAGKWFKVSSKGADGDDGAVPWLPPADWVTATAYTNGPPASVVGFNGETYVCLIAHTSGTFATDLAAGKWYKIASSAALRRIVQLQVTDPNGDQLSTGDGKAYFLVPPDFNGMNLVAVQAAVSTVSSSGAPTVQIANVTDAVDMLSTKLSIDASEPTSATAATAAVIDTAHDDVATADLLRIDIDVAGTGAKGLIVTMIFQ